ncbi:hypothetical protein [Verminephrobacter eiseniae]|uniref:hypothetical protein n=1 Tax=Verminephrobacter eiseniae TaxID=364317 RepID=UPI0010F1E8A0|nr:hypothetical protein [Verminephrobacter eiseniae]KAB7572451.1 hypothetical protein ET532_019730 [Verminephrobacter sp. Larva24]MCW5232002.1 hypothetical protein [Verminephrobacter eiseniae]MCW5258867.1 hypothetical protein [Verminephrobacter eiseniae]MCW5296436.1 hypothetical protein [Verminephrobacter eiseniae]MCW8184558.1 hypothetical protein [Verminephrobacter eiseniae]
MGAASIIPLARPDLLHNACLPGGEWTAACWPCMTRPRANWWAKDRAMGREFISNPGTSASTIAIEEQHP